MTIRKRLDQLEAGSQPSGGVAVIKFPAGMPKSEQSALVDEWKAGRAIEGVVHDLPRAQRAGALIVMLQSFAAC